VIKILLVFINSAVFAKKFKKKSSFKTRHVLMRINDSSHSTHSCAPDSWQRSQPQASGHPNREAEFFKAINKNGDGV